MQLGVRPNLNQVLQHSGQVLLVGMTVGMMRNVVPALAASEFGVPRDSFLWLVTFVVAFGLVKGAMNFVAGRLAEQHGRRRVLLWGWLLAWPIPFMVEHSPNWSWIVAATLLLGAHQGLTWSMTQTSVLDLTKPGQRGLVIGLNEFAGYVGVALAGIATGYAADLVAPRTALLWFGAGVIGLASLSAFWGVAESQPWLGLHPATANPSQEAVPTTWQVFQRMTWQDKGMMALCQAGLVEKFVDALVWIVWPAFLLQRGLTLANIGWVLGCYGFTWGVLQLFTGPLSDKVGRQRLNVGGMWLCGLGVALFPWGQEMSWWMGTAALSGLGMAMLYPNLSAAVVDLSSPAWRASAIGIYRFWRDVGYAFGAAGIGLMAFITGTLDSSFGFVAVCMFISGSVLQWTGRPSAS